MDYSRIYDNDVEVVKYGEKFFARTVDHFMYENPICTDLCDTYSEAIHQYITIYIRRTVEYPEWKLVSSVPY
jgi:hypothetical protein